MVEDDKHAFAEIYRGTCATYGREASLEAMRMAWAALSGFDLALVRKAYSAHVVSSRFMPTPAEIIDLINADQPAMRRPGADEAFALMPRTEDDSVVWTEEMAEAWGVASSLVNPLTVERPDWVAARMAFKDAYQRAVDAAKAQGRPVKWSLSRGQSSDNLKDVVSEAVRLGRLSPEAAREHVAELAHQQPMVAGLLEGATSHPATREVALTFVQKLKAMLEPERVDEAAMSAARAECEARDAEQAKRSAA